MRRHSGQKLRGHIAAGERAKAFRHAGESIGINADNTQVLVRKVQEGFPFAAIEKFRKTTNFSIDEIAEWVRIPARTMSRRRVEGRLQPDESDRLLRASVVFEKAVELFEGDVPAATQWLQTSQPALGDHTPLEFTKTEVGAREVENLIGRLEHGVFT